MANADASVPQGNEAGGAEASKVCQRSYELQEKGEGEGEGEEEGKEGKRGQLLA